MQSVFYQWYWTAIDLLFPPTCGGCNGTGVRWCNKCQQAVKFIEPPICMQCGQPVPSSDVCYRCHDFSSNLAAVRSLTIFEGPIRKAIHRIKYQQDRGLTEIFANLLGIFFKEELNWPVDMVIPVPLSGSRIKLRGYNQAALLAKPLAKDLDLQYSNIALKRVRDTRSQVGLSLPERQFNVAKVFRASKIVSNKCILIVDDVATSGSTLESCAKALQHAGALYIYGLTLARASL